MQSFVFSLRRAGCAAAVVAVATMCTSAHGAAKHRYSFDSDASDSVNGADGMVVDAGVTPNFSFAGGMLDLSANTGEGSNGITEDAYVDLPNFLISDAAASGAAGTVTLEFWATVAETHTWQRFGDFGTSNDGEDTSASGENGQYMLIAANSGRFNNGLEITNHPSTNAGEPNVGVDGELAVGVEQHVVAVYDHNNTSAGPNGTMTLYQNGALVGSNELHADFDATAAVDNNNWLGRSQWNDPVFDGSYNEFRVYDHGAGPAQVARSYAAGPDGATIPEPMSLAILGIGAVSAQLMVRRRR